MFNHAFTAYKNNAYPADELDPLRCEGKYRTNNPHDWHLNDILGNFSLTLVDSLDSLCILGFKNEFEHSIRLVIDNVHFDLDARVQVFEVTIRMLGGLLSAHLLATDHKLGCQVAWYNGELLDMAVDLADRLLPAFHTSSGIPFPRVYQCPSL